MDFVKNLYRYKRLRHVAVGRHLLHDIAFSVHGLFCMEDKGLTSRARLLRIVADLPNSIARHLMFQLSTSTRCFCCGSFPSAPHRGHVPIVVRRLARFPGASRHSCSHSRHRCLHSQTRHRHSRSHCCTRDRPRGLWETLYQAAKLLILGVKMAGRYTKSQNDIAMMPPSTVQAQSIQSH